MSDIIRLLPDSIANQIAAGEVIQRPASAVKELMENSIDAEATKIQLIVKDAGRSLLQVVDNGKGMTETDARMCFERHATSKLRDASDLFNIRTKGFRGEALASIASIAHVELRTKVQEAEIGTFIFIEGNIVQKQEPCQCNTGTAILVRNLFYNVPARRNFLKSDLVEFRHILEEYHRVAIAHPEIGFTLHHNGHEVSRLDAGSLRLRIISIFGQGHNERLVPVEEDTSIVKVTGFIGKPEYSKKTRGEQYFFINKRFIRSPYLHHALQAAFEDLITRDHFVSYFIFLEVDPAKIDVNIHPTKTEVKFEDEHHIYSIIRSAVKRSLGKFNVSPTLDFEQENSIKIDPYPQDRPVVPPVIKVNPDFNPFSTKVTGQQLAGKKEIETWFDKEVLTGIEKSQTVALPAEKEVPAYECIQIHGSFILSAAPSGLLLIHMKRAHERILYERILKEMGMERARSQQLLFPQHLELSPEDHVSVKELLPSLRKSGFDLDEFGKNTFIIQGTPPGLSDGEAILALQSIIDTYKFTGTGSATGINENIAVSLASNMAIKEGKLLQQPEMQQLMRDLFLCEYPALSPTGKPTLVTMSVEELLKRFGS